MNKTILLGLLALVIIGGLYFITKTPKIEVPAENNSISTEQEETNTNNGKTNTTKTSQTKKNEVGNGHVVFSVTDLAVGMDNISEITMEINKVEIHNSTDGWIVVPTEPRTYDLLSLNEKNESRLLADVGIRVGTYDQIRLGIESVFVKTKEPPATREAKLPSHELKINTKLVVKVGTTSSINFDFLADKSLHITGQGEYIFAPVVKTESKSGVNINVNPFNVVTMVDGVLNDTNTVGMDIDGSMKANFQINGTKKLNITASGAIEIK